ncbi:MAG TPA: prolyl oligopeptidase family serine peptidase [Thermoanaerobaculia bacterium]|nr:prolyl oligopeptidase family serine peptidase [Thermoanaerobaculia bacterium]
MKRFGLVLTAVLAACAGSGELPVQTSAPSSSVKPSSPSPPLKYPESPRGDQVDVLHGQRVEDPYRWLEDLDSEQTRAWVAAQNRLTFSYLERLPQRDEIRHRLTELWDYERYDTPFKQGGRYFLSKNDGLQNQSVLYTLDSLEGTPRVLLDPNTLSQDGTIALADYQVSEDGRYLAYGLASGGSDWQEWKVRDVTTGRDTADHLRWVKFSYTAWTHDNQGFFYCRYDEPREGRPLEETNYFHKVYYHKLGTPQSRDELVYERPDRKTMGFIPQVSEDGRYLILFAWTEAGSENGVFYRDLTVPGSKVEPLLDRFDASYNFVDNDGPVFWFRTNLEAPRSKVVAIDTRNPARENWREVIPQGADNLEGVQFLGGHFIGRYLQDAHSQVRVYDRGGRLVREVGLPGLGTVGAFSGRRDDRESFYSFSGYTTPATIYRYDLETGKSTLFRRPKLAFDPSAFETRQVFYTSADGTRVPMFLTYKKGLKLDGARPTYLYGYGGFNIPSLPEFSLSAVVWMEHGGVFAIPNLRGGGEYGQEWYRSATRLHKHRTFDDFIAAAEWLIANHYTSPRHLAIAGHSNGGLLVGAVLNERPELFGAVMVGVGVLDMLRFHKFTIGWGWIADYGSPDDPEEFKVLYGYSPYHNLRQGFAYPPVLITTADHDDRVVPVHSFKYTAALQHAQKGTNPVLLRVETRAGHGGGKPTSKLIEGTADEMAFLLNALEGNAAAPGQAVAR